MDPVGAVENITMKVTDQESGKSLRKYFFIFLFVVLGMLLWTFINSPMIMTVTGTGERSVPAQNAVISFTLISSNANAGQAITDLKAKSENMRKLLRTNGIGESDVTETQVTVLPQQTGGFQASVGMGLKTKNLSNVTNIISVLYSNGAYVVSQPVLTADDIKKYEDEAFNEALRNAHKEGDKLAFKNWKIFKKVISVDQASTPSSTTATSKTNDPTKVNGSDFSLDNRVFKITKVVSITYKVW